MNIVLQFGPYLFATFSFQVSLISSQVCLSGSWYSHLTSCSARIVHFSCKYVVTLWSVKHELGNWRLFAINNHLHVMNVLQALSLSHNVCCHFWKVIKSCLFKKVLFAKIQPLQMCIYGGGMSYVGNVRWPAVCSCYMSDSINIKRNIKSVSAHWTIPVWCNFYVLCNQLWS